jgi:RHS repeat-associated protein
VRRPAEADFPRRKRRRAPHRLSQQPLRGQQNHGHDKLVERGATAPLGGNRKQSTLGGQVQSLSIDPASNRLLALAGSPPIAYTYDLAGNRSTDGQTHYTYDAAGRLVQTTSANGTTRYQVNALNQRTRKTGPLGDTTYLHDRQGHLLAETDSQGRIQREYVWLDDQLLAILDGDPSATQVYAVHPDPLGTPRAVTDPTGKLVWRAAPASEPFGLSVEQDPDGDGTPFVLNLRFPGQYFDKETNLAYNWHRYYDERVGGYTTSDPIGLAGGAVVDVHLCGWCADGEG